MDGRGSAWGRRRIPNHLSGTGGNGNAIAYVDMATGAKSATYEYGAFGETLIADGVAAVAMPFRFSTKYTDTETSLLYYVSVASGAS